MYDADTLLLHNVKKVLEKIISTGVTSVVGPFTMSHLMSSQAETDLRERGFFAAASKFITE